MVLVCTHAHGVKWELYSLYLYKECTSNLTPKKVFTICATTIKQAMSKMLPVFKRTG